jgi:antitoxin component YwqK of YwqJK toxin-antitoxin module
LQHKFRQPFYIYKISLNHFIEKEYFKEYYPNGFLKIESEIINLDKNGIYREFYDNGNTMHEGVFKDDKPIDKQYY